MLSKTGGPTARVRFPSSIKGNDMMDQKKEDYEAKYVKLRETCRNLIKLYRDYMMSDGLVASYRVTEWIDLCELVGEPTERDAIPDK